MSNLCLNGTGPWSALTFDLVIREGLRIWLFGHNVTKVFTFVQTERMHSGNLILKNLISGGMAVSCTSSRQTCALD
jgi:hypothetical protein